MTNALLVSSTSGTSIGANVVVVVVDVVDVVAPAPSTELTGDVVGFVVGVEFEGATVFDGAVVFVGATEVAGDTVLLGTVVATVVSIVTVVAVTADDGPVFDDASSTELATSRRMTVPSVLHVAVTDTEVPDAALTAIVHDADPTLMKSLAAIPETGSLNTTVYSNVRDDDGEVGADSVAVGGVVSAASVVNLTPPDAVGS